MGAYHHSMARPRRVAVNIWNRQSRTADKGLSSSLGAGRGADSSRSKEPACHEMVHRASDLDWFFGKPTQWKMDMKFGIYWTGSYGNGGMVWTGCIQLRIETCGGFLWTR